MTTMLWLIVCAWCVAGGFVLGAAVNLTDRGRQ
jgi:hypothetical protein